MSLLILREKHDERYYNFGSKEEFELLASYIVRERYNDGWYEENSKLLHQALGGDNKAAVRFLRERQYYEYEDFEVIEPETVDSFKGEENSL